MRTQRGQHLERGPTHARRGPFRGLLLGALLGLPMLAVANQRYPEPTPAVVSTPSGQPVPTAPASAVVLKAPHAPDPKLVKAPLKPTLSPSAQRRLEPDGMGVRLHDPRLRETIREVAEERAAHDGDVERHNQESRRGIRQTLADADAQAVAREAAAAKAREARQGFWYRLFHGGS